MYIQIRGAQTPLICLLVLDKMIFDVKTQKYSLTANSNWLMKICLKACRLFCS